MAANRQDPVLTRKKYVEGWNNTMIDIWFDQMKGLFGPRSTGALVESVRQHDVHADGRYYEVELTQSFLEYGLWVNYGVGREVFYGNPGDIGRKKVREPKKWFSPKYFSSNLHIRDFYGRSLGEDFKYMFATALDYDRMRYGSKYYKKKGYTR